MRVARVLVANESGFKMLRRCFVFSASIKGQTEGDVGRREPRITFECFGVRVARVAFSALLIIRDAFDVALFGTLTVLRIRDRPRGRRTTGAGRGVRVRLSRRRALRR